MEEVNLFADILRLVGRIGFVLLVIGIYRIYLIVASPLLKKNSKTFVVTFAVALVFSFVLTVLDFLSHLGWLRDFSMTFNVVSTFILAIYLNFKANRVKSTLDTTEYVHFTNAMDALLTRLKQK